jgi:hypothetical protein
MPPVRRRVTVARLDRAVNLLTEHSIGFALRSKNLKLLKIKCLVEKDGVNLYPARDDAGKGGFRPKARYCDVVLASCDSSPMFGSEFASLLDDARSQVQKQMDDCCPGRGHLLHPRSASNRLTLLGVIVMLPPSYLSNTVLSIYRYTSSWTI